MIAAVLADEVAGELAARVGGEVARAPLGLVERLGEVVRVLVDVVPPGGDRVRVGGVIGRIE